jgi:transcriptional regulator with XRE-family HTH domain
MRLGTLLLSWRQLGGISQREAALSMGISHPILSRLENGKGVNADTLARIMVWLVSDKNLELRTEIYVQILPTSDQPKIDVQLNILSLSFDFSEAGITAKVDFSSSHPEMTGDHVERLFYRGETINDILQEHISTFHTWIPDQEDSHEKSVLHLA